MKLYRTTAMQRHRMRHLSLAEKAELFIDCLHPLVKWPLRVLVIYPVLVVCVPLYILYRAVVG